MRGFNFNLIVLFQPAEEASKRNGVYQGGASQVVEEGGMKGVDEIYGTIFLIKNLIGYHNWPCRPFGKCLLQAGIYNNFFVQFVKGNFLPSVSIIDFKIIGKGGHGSVPEKCLDPSNNNNKINKLFLKLNH